MVAFPAVRGEAGPWQISSLFATSHTTTLQEKEGLETALLFDIT